MTVNSVAEGGIAIEVYVFLIKLTARYSYPRIHVADWQRRDLFGSSLIVDKVSSLHNP